MDQVAADRRRRVILGVMIVSLTAVVLDNTVLNIALKTISEPRVGPGASQSQLEWAINSCTLVFAGLLFTFGVVGDRIGRRRMLIIGVALFGLASLVSSCAQTPDELTWARAAMGLGGAAVMPGAAGRGQRGVRPRDAPGLGDVGGHRAAGRRRHAGLDAGPRGAARRRAGDRGAGRAGPGRARR